MSSVYILCRTHSVIEEGTNDGYLADVVSSKPDGWKCGLVKEWTSNEVEEENHPPSLNFPVKLVERNARASDLGLTLWNEIDEIN